ncbi:ABC transporter permease [Pseudomonas gingeri NCPPB 3146 = LMG 5327]|uniref:ABC transporter permease n=2 Tax=Pseudomonas gingeri TaxID=117681 RepID=A0A7Y8CGS3_9PSED|nr:ABC transporter permease [Pseudomonas gingeri]NWC18269.1 ABC transporter permease [Pseudomonas gingeri]NWE46235.1 ABC transporter permease [Pseudomonas gingeri]PNQ90405.1 ABC transporter permease [Pseudomonas gingeri NCPPB 3146 = LMG 5327]
MSLSPDRPTVALPGAAGAVVVRRSRARLFDALLNLPGGLITFTLILFALGLLLFMSLRVNDGQILGTAFTLDNLKQALIDPLTRLVLLRSILLSAIVTFATVALAYPVAYFLAFHAGRWRHLLLFLVTLPFWTSYLLRVFAWKIVLAYNGVLNSGLLHLGLIDTPLNGMLNTPTAVVITLAHAYAAFAVLPLFISLNGLARNLLEAADDLGATPRQRFMRVVLPLSMPGVLSAALVVFVPTVGDYVTPALVGGPDSSMIGTLIQAQFGKANDWPAGAALAVISMLTIAVVVLLAQWIFTRWSTRT